MFINLYIYNKLTIPLIIFIDVITSLENLEIISLSIVERHIIYGKI